MENEASQLKRDHVHSVYETIAPYLSDEQYKAWPKVQQFISGQEPGSLFWLGRMAYTSTSVLNSTNWVVTTVSRWWNQHEMEAMDQWYAKACVCLTAVSASMLSCSLLVLRNLTNSQQSFSLGFHILCPDGVTVTVCPEMTCDFLEIQVIHHFSGEERPMKVIKETARILRVGGQIMMYVWATEQKWRRFE